VGFGGSRVDSMGVAEPKGTNLADSGSTGRQITPIQVAFIGFLIVSAVLLVLGRFAEAHEMFPGRQEFEPGGGWFGQWVRWDGNWYFHIAHDGYDWGTGQFRAIAFWPSYPLAIRALSVLTNDEYDSGLIITWLSGCTAIVLLARWCQDRMTRAASIAAVVTLLVFPFGWYLQWAVYGDAFFAACALGAFLLLERDRPALAGLLGAVAAAGRPMGIAVAAGLIVVMLQRRKVSVGIAPARITLGRLRLKDAGVFIAPLGPVLYLGFLARTQGTPLAFIDAESVPGWGHKPGPHTWFKVAIYENWRNGGLTQGVYAMLLHGAIAIGAILLIPQVIRKFGWGYGIYCLLLIGIPAVSSKDFYGLGRYLLAAFPVLAVIGDWLATRPALFRCGVWSVSAALALLLSYSYARGVYVA